MKFLITMVATVALASLPAQADPYTRFIYESAQQLALRPGNDAAALAYWQAYDIFGKELASAGVLRGGSALATGAPVSQITAGDGIAVAAPYAVSPLALGGYFQIEVASDADAIAWASKMPVVDGVVEVRAGYPVPAMAM
ncbi:MAG: hypothetical protein KKF33_05910 [Alphaproteobacteria bacterium]|nr:hypothetical protein [Alphaproteobacteria bacterium]